MDGAKLSYFVQRAYVAIVNNCYDYIPSCDTGQNLGVENACFLFCWTLLSQEHILIKG